MAGGTITITNVGVFGVDNGTPILNPGESAILCFGAVRPTPWVVDGEIRVRQVTQLSLSFDHRIVDGQLGSQFLADVARVLSDPDGGARLELSGRQTRREPCAAARRTVPLRCRPAERRGHGVVPVQLAHLLHGRAEALEQVRGVLLLGPAGVHEHLGHVGVAAA